MNWERKRKRQLKWGFRIMNFGTKLGLPSVQERMGELYIEIARESKQGKTILENMEKAGDKDAQAVLAMNTPGIGMIFLRLKAAKGDRVAQMMLEGYDNE